MDFLSCKKSQSKKNILQTPRPCQAWVKANNFFAMKSKFFPFLFANNLQKAKITVKYTPPHFSFGKHWNTSIHIFTCFYLLLLKSSSKSIWFSVTRQILQILPGKMRFGVKAPASSSSNTCDLAYPKSVRGLAQPDNAGAPGATLACTACGKTCKPGARRSLLLWDVGCSGRGTRP